MVGLRKRGEKIRQFILENVERYPKDIVRMAVKKFKISRQAINKHMRLLISQESIMRKGVTSNCTYYLHPDKTERFVFTLDRKLEEDVIWRNDILPLLDNLPDNVENVWYYCFSEIFNNAIDHSNGSYVSVFVEKSATMTKIRILDDGEGIFKKIKKEFRLHDEQHAALELSKGKVTTDPENHTGEGIFFSSRMMEQFVILSGKTFFSHNKKDDIDWIFEQEHQQGTCVYMWMKNNTTRTVKGVFDEFANPEHHDYGFAKTIVGVKFLQHGDEMLVSRSQAKRLLANVDRFKIVVLDFKGVSSIGQAFADEIFRVFANRSPTTRIVPINMDEDVQQMVVRVL